jgi:hypothetical protein
VGELVGRLKQKDHEFKASWGYIAKPSQRKKIKKRRRHYLY